MIRRFALFCAGVVAIVQAPLAQEIDESVLPSFEEGMGITDEPVTEEEIGRIFTIDP
ncbi:hypothetical protein HA071_25455, partial [Escherichia coli]|nr:hypothetical protein [Escherichia coli]